MKKQLIELSCKVRDIEVTKNRERWMVKVMDFLIVSIALFILSRILLESCGLWCWFVKYSNNLDLIMCGAFVNVWKWGNLLGYFRMCWSTPEQEMDWALNEWIYILFLGGRMGWILNFRIFSSAKRLAGWKWH